MRHVRRNRRRRDGADDDRHDRVDRGDGVNDRAAPDISSHGRHDHARRPRIDGTHPRRHHDRSAGAATARRSSAFSAGDTHVDVTIAEDNLTTATSCRCCRSPCSSRSSTAARRSATSHGPRHHRPPGSDPEDGDLIYYAPWGNLGFYYNTAGIGFSDHVIHLGTYNATPDELTALEDGDVTVDIAP